MRCAACGHTQAGGRFCGGCGARLDDGDTGRSGGAPDAGGAAGERGGWLSPRRGGLLVAGAVVAALLLAGGAVLLDGGSGPDTVALPTAVSPPATTGGGQPGEASPAPAPEPTVGLDFAGRTGTALVFAEGDGDAVVIDLDRRRRTRLGLAGTRSDGRPFRLARLGGWLVYGRGDVWAVDPGSRHPTQRLGEATRFVPAAAPDRLWLVDEREGPSGSQRELWRLVDPSGRVLYEHEGAAGLTAVRGVPGGLAVRDRAGGPLRRHDPDTGGTVDYVGGPDSRLGDVTRQRVAWCRGGCRALHVTAADGRTVTTLEGGGIVRFGPVWLSPDGSRLAAYVRVREGTGVSPEIRVFSLPEGRRVGRQTTSLGAIAGRWTAAGDQFFYWLQDPAQRAPPAPARLGRYTVAGDRFEEARLDPQGARLRGFVTMPAAAVESLF